MKISVLTFSYLVLSRELEIIAIHRYITSLSEIFSLLLCGDFKAGVVVNSSYESKFNKVV